MLIDISCGAPHSARTSTYTRACTISAHWVSVGRLQRQDDACP